MTIDLKQSKLIPITIGFLLLIRTVVTFNVFEFLRPLSFVVWGLCLLCFFFLLIVYVRERETTQLGLCVCGFYLLLVIISLLMDADVQTALYKGIEAFMLLMLVKLYQHQMPLLLKVFALTFSFTIYMNLALMILFPSWLVSSSNGTLADSFILGGNYNAMGCRILCGIVTNVLCVKYSKWFGLNVCFLVLSAIITLTLVGSMTSLSNVIFFSLFCLIPSLQIKKMIIIAYFIFFLFFQLVVVFSGEGIHNNELAVYVIQDVLNKDVTFTGRTFWWDISGKLFSESPIIGYGCVDTEWYLTHLSSVAIGPHNFIFSILLNGGLALLSMFLLICGVAVKNIFSLFEKRSSLLLMGTVTMLVMMTMEVYPFFFLLYLLVLIYYYNDFRVIDSEEEDNPEDQTLLAPEVV